MRTETADRSGGRKDGVRFACASAGEIQSRDDPGKEDECRRVDGPLIEAEEALEDGIHQFRRGEGVTEHAMLDSAAQGVDDGRRR